MLSPCVVRCVLHFVKGVARYRSAPSLAPYLHTHRRWPHSAANAVNALACGREHTLVGFAGPLHYLAQPALPGPACITYPGLAPNAACLAPCITPNCPSPCNPIGTVYACGRNSFGTLGIGRPTTPSMASSPTLYILRSELCIPTQPHVSSYTSIPGLELLGAVRSTSTPFKK